MKWTPETDNDVALNDRRTGNGFYVTALILGYLPAKLARSQVATPAT